MRAGRSKSMGLGSLRKVTLADARVSASDANKLLHQNIDPLVNKRINATQTTIPSFTEASKQYIDTHKASWRNTKHIDQWTNTLRDYANPTIGTLSVDQVDRTHVVEILLPIWLLKPETARRVRGRIERILDWSRAEGFRHGDNPARFKGNLEFSLPTQKMVESVVHHPALTWQALPKFYKKLTQQEGVAAKALQFTILTAARTNEVRFATADEFDLNGIIPTWHIPADRMKARRDHRVPLTRLAADLVRERTTESTYIFSPHVGKALSENGMLSLLKRMNTEGITVHGFRSTFRDWCAENTEFSREAIETSLAHQNPNRVEAAYLRSDLFDKRYALMCEWSKFVTSNLTER